MFWLRWGQGRKIHEAGDLLALGLIPRLSRCVHASVYVRIQKPCETSEDESQGLLRKARFYAESAET